MSDEEKAALYFDTIGEGIIAGLYPIESPEEQAKAFNKCMKCITEPPFECANGEEYALKLLDRVFSRYPLLKENIEDCRDAEKAEDGTWLSDV